MVYLWGLLGDPGGIVICHNYFIRDHEMRFQLLHYFSQEAVQTDRDVQVKHSKMQARDVSHRRENQHKIMRQDRTWIQKRLAATTVMKSYVMFGSGHRMPLHFMDTQQYNLQFILWHTLRAEIVKVSLHTSVSSVCSASGFHTLL